MARIVASGWYLASTALCCGIAVALASWVTEDSSGANRVLAALIALGAGMGVMVLLAWALAAEDPAPDTATPTEIPPSPVPAAGGLRAPALQTTPASPRSTEAESRALLAAYLDEGRALREELEPGTSSARIDAWIDRVHETIRKPGVAAYFHALAAKTYVDDADRLDAHIARLTTIIREFV